MKTDKSPKQKKSSLKYVTETEVDEWNKKSTSDLLKDYLTQQKALRDISKRKKQDTELKLVKEEIKKHRDESPSAEDKKKIEKLRAQLKEIKLAIDDEIPELLKDLKERNADYREDAGYPKEKANILQRIIDARGEK